MATVLKIEVIYAIVGNYPSDIFVTGIRFHFLASFMIEKKPHQNNSSGMKLFLMLQTGNTSSFLENSDGEKTYKRHRSVFMNIHLVSVCMQHDPTATYEVVLVSTECIQVPLGDGHFLQDG